MVQTRENRITIVISGSFRKHIQGIQEKIREFEALGISVLSPKASKVINPKEEFAILETDDTAEPKTLEQRHLDAIYESDALYIYNPDGYLGASATMELGWALALGKPVYAKETPQDFTLKLFSGKIASPPNIKKELLEKQNNLPKILNHRHSLKKLQEHVHKTTLQRGFGDETPADVMLLMVEEVGELAKALRKHASLKIDQNKKESYNKLEHELADVFIYLLDLANTCQVDLFEAFREKEYENNKRVWG